MLLFYDQLNNRIGIIKYFLGLCNSIAVSLISTIMLLFIHGNITWLLFTCGNIIDKLIDAKDFSFNIDIQHYSEHQHNSLCTNQCNLAKSILVTSARDVIVLQTFLAGIGPDVPIAFR